MCFRRNTCCSDDADTRRNVYVPTIGGILFVNVDETAVDKQSVLAEKRRDIANWTSRERLTQVIRQLVTPWGYFKSTDADGYTVYSNAHLLGANHPHTSIDEIIRRSSVSESDIEEFRFANEHLTDVDDIQIVDVPYHQLEQENGTACIMEGPYIGFKGVIKQVSFEKKKKDRCLFMRMGSFSIRLANVRKYRSVIISDPQAGEKAENLKLWYHTDMLIGALQAFGFADDASARLRMLLTAFSKAKFTIDHYQQFVQAKQALPNTSGKASAAIQGFSYAEMEMLNDFRKQNVLASLDEYIVQMSPGEEGSLVSLCLFFRKCANMEQAVNDVIADTPLRPFLTPVANSNFEVGKPYTLLRHKDFTEVIIRKDLKPYFYIPSQPAHAADTSSPADEFTYDAHIALLPTKDGKVIAFVNWSGFQRQYDILSRDERADFLNDLEKKGYKKTYTLLSSSDKGISAVSFSSLPVGDNSPSQLAGFHLTITPANSQILQSADPMQDAAVSRAVGSLLDACIPSAVELWQGSRLLTWRSLVQKYVFIRK